MRRSDRQNAAHPSSVPEVPPNGGEASTKWIRIEDEIPRGEALLAKGTRLYVGILVRNEADGSDPGVFMDPISCDQLPYPSHWTYLPEPPSAAMQDDLSGSE